MSRSAPITCIDTSLGIGRKKPAALAIELVVEALHVIVEQAGNATLGKSREVGGRCAQSRRGYQQPDLPGLWHQLDQGLRKLLDEIAAAAPGVDQFTCVVQGPVDTQGADNVEPGLDNALGLAIDPKAYGVHTFGEPRGLAQVGGQARVDASQAQCFAVERRCGCSLGVQRQRHCRHGAAGDRVHQGGPWFRVASWVPTAKPYTVAGVKRICPSATADALPGRVSVSPGRT